MTIISNASPLINLAWIGKLELIELLYTEVVIPQAVWNEVVEKGEGQPGALEVQNAEWIKVKSVLNQELVKSLRQDLDAGEAEAIALAVEENARFLIMDEHLGRETATYFSIPVIGLIGVLIEAKHKGFIAGLKPYLDQLRSTSGFYIKPTLYQMILQEIGELAG